MFPVRDLVVIQRYFCHNDYLAYISDILVMHSTQQYNLCNINMHCKRRTIF